MYAVIKLILTSIDGGIVIVISAWSVKSEIHSPPKIASLPLKLLYLRKLPLIAL